MLVQERMSHIEELRLIHADINIVCVENKKKHFSFILNNCFCIDGNNN
jgi:hypothetical protein